MGTDLLESRRAQFLELAELDVLSRALNLNTPTLRVSTRVEAYSCKAVSRERKLFKALESELIQDISHSTSVSPPEHHQHLLDSAFGPLDQRNSRKTLWLLIALLNVAFPDHDFSKVRPEEFRRETSARSVLSSLSSALDQMRSPESHRSFSSYPPSSTFAFPSSPFQSNPLLASTPVPTLEGDAIPTNPFLRQVLDPIIDLAECEVFSYTPDMDSDPHAAESDDESDDEGESDAFEKDDEGMAWEMDGVDTFAGNQGSGNRGGGSSGQPGLSHHQMQARYPTGPTTPMKSFSSFFPPSPAPGTPNSVADSEEYFTGESNQGLLWSSNFFLYNKKMKRILFISIWARRGGEGRMGERGAKGASASTRMKRKASSNPDALGGGMSSRQKVKV